MTERDKLLRELELSIVQAELLTTAYTTALMDMDQASPGAAEAELCLWREMDALTELRIQRINRQDELSISRQKFRATGLD